MDLISRPARLDDFHQFYDACYSFDRAHRALRGQVEREWAGLIQQPATLSVVIEDLDRPAGGRLVGCAQAAFLTVEFARLLRQGLPPWVNRQAITSLSDGSAPLLDFKGLAQANASEGLSGLMTRWTIAWPLYEGEAVRRLRHFLLESFSVWARGYKLREVFVESIGEAAREEARHAGFQILDTYKEYYARHPPQPPPRAHPCLLHLTREEARRTPSITAEWIFAYTPPRHHFNFSEKEQRVLRLALTHATDAEIAEGFVPAVSVARVRQHWQSIYRRCEAALQLGQDKKEKKGALLRYLRRHPEELCPTDTARQHKQP